MAAQTKCIEFRDCFSRTRSAVLFITFAVGFAIFTEAYLYGVLDAVFPYSLKDRNHLREDHVQEWTATLFAAEALGLLTAPVFGCLSDHIGNRKRPLLFGILVLIAAHLDLCLAPNLAGLFTGRVLQGVSAGIVWCVGLALIADISPADKVGRMIGHATSAFAYGAFAAPFVGGALYKHRGWYAVFAIGFGLIAMDAVLRFLIVEPKHDSRSAIRANVHASSDMLPQVITAESSLSQDKDTDESHRFGESSATNNQIAPVRKGSTSTDQTLFTVTSSTLTESKHSPTRWNRLKRFPLFVLLQTERMWVNFFVNVAVSMIISGLNVTLALFVEEQFHWDSQASGLIYFALGAPTILQAFYGHLVDRFGPRWPATAGFLLVAPAFACFRFVESDSMKDKVVLSVLLIVIGLGGSLTLAATMTEFTFIAKEQERREPGSMGKSGAYAQSYSIFNISWALGAIAGSKFAGTIHERCGWGVLGYSYAGLSAAITIVAILGCGGWIGDKKKDSHQEKCESLNSTEHLV